MPRGVGGNHRVIIAVRKHIEPEDSLTSGGEGISVQKSPDDGVVISALQVIETGFAVAVVAPVAQGVEVGDGQVAEQLWQVCQDRYLPTGGFPFCPCRKETKTRQRGEIPDLSPLWTPLIQTAKRGAPLLDIPEEERNSGALTVPLIDSQVFMIGEIHRNNKLR